jgi:hypothetical protein
MITAGKQRPVGDAACGFLVVMLVLVCVLLPSRPAEAAPSIFTVDRSDDPDLSTNPVADNCTAGIAEDCSLRGAITKANRTANDAAGPDEIRFNIPGAGPHTISPTTSLPGVTDTVTIDGYTQPGASPRTGSSAAVLKIQLNGASAGQTFTGLTLEDGADGTMLRGLVVQRFFQGIIINARNTVVEGNYIGTNASGDSAQGNSVHGVRVQSSGNLIGGTGAGARNLISGNGDTGLVIVGLAARNNRVEGNRIGTNASGTEALGNDLGVNITDGDNNFIGSPGGSNLIAGNSGGGVLIAGDAVDNHVQSNFIGTDGVRDLGNATDGVEIFEGSNNVIGGTASRTGNIISGNGANGVEVHLGAENSRVEGNFIGTGQNGATDLGNDEVGVLVRGPGNIIGGTVSGARNLISGNVGVGIEMLGSGANGNRVQGNIIGTEIDGSTPLPNFHGVFIFGAKNNLIGGDVAAAANTISGNANNGVQVFDDAATGNRILRNSIYNNGTSGGLGIELGNDGSTANDGKDPDTGPNGLQNFPVITSVTTNRIEGILKSRPNKRFKVQIFFSPIANRPTFFGVGEAFIKEVTVTTNRKGRASFAVNLDSGLPDGHVVTATATDPGGNTSEFSAPAGTQ